MARGTRIEIGGICYHVLNRAAFRSVLFATDRDYAAFEKLLAEGLTRFPVRLLSYCLMPTHWHLALWPKQDGALSKFMAWIGTTHTRRRHLTRGTSGAGAIYQGRYRSFPIEHDDHLVTVCRYVERNALRANLVTRAEDWRWSSLWLRQGNRGALLAHLSDWPIEIPKDWCTFVNEPQTAAEVLALQKSLRTNAPYGRPEWVDYLGHRQAVAAG